MNDILVKVGADISSFSKSMNEATGKLKNFGQKNAETFDAFKKVGAGFTAVGAGIGGMFVGAIKEAANFEQGMSKVKAISGATADEMAQLSEKAREMGSKTKFSALESSEAFSYMARQTWPVVEKSAA